MYYIKAKKGYIQSGSCGTDSADMLLPDLRVQECWWIWPPVLVTENLG